MGNFFTKPHSTSGRLTRVVALAVCAVAGLFGQAGSGTITGTLTDPSGAVVPGATVVILNTDTGVARSTSTNQAGIYSAAFLQPDDYSVTASKTGFATQERKNLRLAVGNVMTIDFAMVVQTGATTITVADETPIIDTAKTGVSQTVDNADVENLPIAGRRWDAFALMTNNTTTDGTNGLVSFRGISGLYNNNTVDGANNNQAFFSEARGRAISGAYVYSMDSIQEYQVSASNYSAELGQAAGGVVNAVTKSGANAYHGDLFYFLRYPTFNALDSFPKSQGVYTQAIHQWQQFGSSLGGRIIKDKLFFFATYDGSRKVDPVAYTSSTYNSNVKALTCPAQVTAVQCANANAFLDSQLGNYPRATNQDVGFGKLDYQMNARNHVSSSFDLMNYRAPNSYQTSPTNNNLSLSTNGSYVFHERIFVSNWDTTISNNMLNSLRFQWGRDLEVAGSNAPAPYVNLTNLMAYGENYALPRTAEPDEHRIQVTDTVSWTKGKHQIKAGYDLNAIHEVMINLFNGPAQYAYNNGTAQTNFNNWVLDVYGINIGDGLTGRHYNTFTQTTDPITGVGKDDFYDFDHAGFVEDSWKIKPRLTLNLGVRYDVQLIPQPPKPNTLTPLLTLYTSKINTDSNNFAPRLGVAFELSKKTVVRAGYGMFYGKTTNSTFYVTRVENGVYQQGFNCTATTCPTLTFPNVIFTPPGPPLTSPFAGALTPQVTTFAPPAATQAARGLSPNFVNPLVHEGEAAIERELPGGMSISASYVFSRGLHLPMFVDANLATPTTMKTYDILGAGNSTATTYTVPYYTSRIDAGTGEIYTGYSDVNSWYNSMVLTLRRQMRHGFEYTVNYTLSKTTDGGEVIGSNGTFSGSDIPVNPQNRKAEYALSDLDQRQRFSASAVWMPTMKIQNKAASQIANGWVLSTIVTANTGFPLTPFITGTPSPLDGGLTGGEASNASATAGRAAWLPRNSFTGPGFKNVDFRLARQFPITEKVKISLIGEAFNLFNHTNFISENTTAFTYAAAGSGACAGHTNACFVPSPLWMTPTATSSLISGSRQLQISGKLTF